MMITIKQLTYLVNEVVFSALEQKTHFTVYIDDSHFEIHIGKQQYNEPIFNFTNTQLSIKDKLFLDALLTTVSETTDNETLQSLYKSIIIDDIPVFKLIHYFVNERYITKPHSADIHQRLTSACVDDSVLPYLQIPIVDLLIDAFLYRYTDYVKPQSTLYLTSDFDFINLWDYLGYSRSLWRLSRQLVSCRFSLFSKELKSFLCAKKQLSHNVILTDSMFLKPKELSLFKIENIAFLLCGYSRKEYDFKNDFSQPSFKQYIDKHKDYVRFGIHPAYNTCLNAPSLAEQLKTFVSITQQHPAASRFHYLKCRYPDDLELLEQHSIGSDFSFYFTDSLLFRGGISRKFKQWSFKLSRPVEVAIIPLTIMDVTLDQTLQLHYENALEVSCNKIRLALLLGNSCVLLWHNNTMYEHFTQTNYHPKLFKMLLSFIELLG